MATENKPSPRPVNQPHNQPRAENPKIAVIGGGAWGTALAAQLASKQSAANANPKSEDNNINQVMLLCRTEQQAKAINETRQNSVYLKDILLPVGVYATANSREALENADIILAVIPTQKLRQGLATVKGYISAHAPIVLCSKGIEGESEKFAAEVAQDVLPNNPLAVLSGPSFAVDVARGLPTAVTLAAQTEEIAQYLTLQLSSATFRCYASTDITGVEIGGSLKNVLALGAGMAHGRGFGASAQAALITRGFAELRRLNQVAGGRDETMTGLAVLGDLILTCSSTQSRNFSYGIALAKGQDIANRPLAEGVTTAPVAATLCRKYNLDAPFIFMVAAILAGEKNIDEAARELLMRPLKFED